MVTIDSKMDRVVVIFDSPFCNIPMMSFVLCMDFHHVLALNRFIVSQYTLYFSLIPYRVCFLRQLSYRTIQCVENMISISFVT